MIDSDRRPLLKSVHWHHYLKSRSNFRIFSNRRPFQTLISIGLSTRSKFAIKNNCNDSFVLRVFFVALCVFKAFSHSLILFRVKVGLRVRVKVRVMFRVRVSVRVKVKLGLGLGSAKVEVQCTLNLVLSLLHHCFNPCPNGCDVIWSIRQWLNWTSIWESEKRTYIWELDTDLRIGRWLEIGHQSESYIYMYIYLYMYIYIYNVHLNSNINKYTT